VLNVILAGTFVGFSGTFLQRQHAYKTLLDAEQKKHDEDKKSDASKIAQAERDYASTSADKSLVQQKLDQMTIDRDSKADEIKGQAARIASLDADLKKLMSVAEANGTAIQTALERANQSFQQATADQKTRDDAVRAKDTAEAENRELKSK